MALLAAALACLALAAARFRHTISLTRPLQLVTSGREEEALASIWRLGHGLTLYTDPRLVPYTASYFNWLFYASYHAMANGALRCLGLGDAWLPTVCRLITFAFALGGAAILIGILRTTIPCRRTWATALGVLAFFNPLSGFWTLTARPDLAATVLELAAFAAFLRHQRTQGWASLAATAGLLGAAWAFKQTFLAVWAALVMSLLIDGFRHGKFADGRRAFFLMATMAANVAPACGILGPAYRHGLYLPQIDSGFAWSSGLRHFGLALLKMPFIAAALIGASLYGRQGRSHPALRTVSLVLVVTLVVELVASCKIGAGDYYFLPLGVWSMLWLGLALEKFPSRPLHGLAGAAALLQFAMVSAIFLGHGVIDPRDPHHSYDQLARDLAGRPGPVFVQDSYGNLPWISPTAPHFIIANNFPAETRAGVTFQDGGWPALLARGYFRTVVTGGTRDQIPAAALARYRLVREESGWRYFERK